MIPPDGILSLRRRALLGSPRRKIILSFGVGLGIARRRLGTPGSDRGPTGGRTSGCSSSSRVIGWRGLFACGLIPAALTVAAGLLHDSLLGNVSVFWLL